MSIRSTLLLFALSLSAVSAAACSRPEIVAGTPAVRCVYGLLKADPDVQSIEVFRRGADRYAIEYTIHDKTGKMTDDTEDIGFLIVGPKTYSVLAFTHGWTRRNADLLWHLRIDLKCAVAPGIDDLRPPPPPRSAWQRVD